MKAPLIAGSLVLNAALVGGLLFRPSLAPARVQTFVARYFGTTAPSVKPAVPAPSRAPAPRANRWELLHSDDPATYVARLRAAGFPASLIRALVTAEISARFEERFRAIQEPDPNTPFWKMRPNYYMMGDARMAEYGQLQRERANLLRDVFKDDFFASDDVTAAQRRQYGALSRSKIDALQRIEDDYNEMIAAVRASTNGIFLPEDREKLALLAREKRADLATVLAPGELADYEMRTSPITNFLRTRLGEFDPSEAEFRALFQAQQAINDKFQGRFDSVAYEARNELQNAYYDQLHAALGDKRYADYLRETSGEFAQLKRIVQLQSLTPDTALVAYNLRFDVERESNRIFDDPTLDTAAKRAALKAVAENTRSRVTATLGPIGGAEYLKIADPWLRNVERGGAVSFTRGTTLAIVTDQGTSSYSGMPATRFLPSERPPGR